MKLATLPVLNNPKQSAIDAQALQMYFLHGKNPLLALIDTSGMGMLAKLFSEITEPPKIVQRLSDDALLTIVRYDIATAVEELCGADTALQTVALQALVARIDAGRINGGRQCMILTLADALNEYRPRGFQVSHILHRVRAHAYDTARPNVLPTEVMMLIIGTHDYTCDAQRVRRILRTAASDLLAECEVDAR